MYNQILFSFAILMLLINLVLMKMVINENLLSYQKGSRNVDELVENLNLILNIKS